MPLRAVQLPVFYQETWLTIKSDLDEAAELRNLAGKIASASIAIEEVIVDIIACTLLREVTRYRELVVSSLLKADWCTFAAKRKLLDLTVQECGLQSGNDKTELQQLLRKVSQYRNAFAHGTLLHDDTHHVLRYFEGVPQRATLDDGYLVELERVFKQAWERLQTIQAKISKP